MENCANAQQHITADAGLSDNSCTSCGVDMGSSEICGKYYCMDPIPTPIVTPENHEEDEFEEMTGNRIDYVSSKSTKELSKRLYEEVFFSANYLANSWAYIRNNLEDLYPDLAIAFEESRVPYDVVVRMITNLSKIGTRGQEIGQIRNVVEKILIGLSKYSEEVSSSSGEPQGYYCLTQEGYNYIEESLFIGGCKISKSKGHEWFTGHTTPVLEMDEGTRDKMESIYPCMFNVKGSSFIRKIDANSGMLESIEFVTKQSPKGTNTRFMVFDEKIKVTSSEENPEEVSIWNAETDYEQWFGFKVPVSIWEEVTGVKKEVHPDWSIPVLYKDGTLQIPEVVRTKGTKSYMQECLDEYLTTELCEKTGTYIRLLYLPWGRYKVVLDDVVDNSTNPLHHIGIRIV